MSSVAWLVASSICFCRSRACAKAFDIVSFQLIDPLRLPYCRQGSGVSSDLAPVLDGHDPADGACVLVELARGSLQPGEGRVVDGSFPAPVVVAAKKRARLVERAFDTPPL